MKKFNLKIVCPSNIVLDIDVRQITFRTLDEVRGLLPDHIPFMASLRSHLMKVIIDDNNIEYYSVKDGFLKFIDNKCVIVSDESYNIKDVTKQSIDKETKYWEGLKHTSDKNEQQSKEAELQLKRISQIKERIGKGT